MAPSMLAFAPVMPAVRAPTQAVNVRMETQADLETLAKKLNPVVGFWGARRARPIAPARRAGRRGVRARPNLTEPDRRASSAVPLRARFADPLDIVSEDVSPETIDGLGCTVHVSREMLDRTFRHPRRPLEGHSVIIEQTIHLLF